MSKKYQKGFTIIEVLIVLAIAGLIMLIVFLAVPALQRNSRNTSRKNDVARIGGAVQETLNNNNGAIAKVTTGTVQATVGDKLSAYTSSNISVAAGAAGNAVNTTDQTTIIVYTGAKCADLPTPADGLGATKDGASTRQVAITYTTETGSGTIKSCSDL